MRGIVLVLCLGATIARAGHDGGAGARPRPAGLDYNRLEPSAGIYPESNNPAATFKPTDPKKPANAEDFYNMISQSDPWFCKKNPPANLHQIGVQAFREIVLKEREAARKQNKPYLNVLENSYKGEYEQLARKTLDSFYKEQGGIPLQIAREFRFTEAGGEAARANLSYLLDSGYLPLFSSYLEDYAKDHPGWLDSCTEDTKAWATKGFLANLMINKKKRAEPYKDVLNRCELTTLSLGAEVKTVKAWDEEAWPPWPKVNPKHHPQITREVLTYTQDPELCSQIEECEPEDFCRFYGQFSLPDTATLAEISSNGDWPRSKYALYIGEKLAGAKPWVIADHVKYLSHMLFDKDARLATVAARALREIPFKDDMTLLARALHTPNNDLFEEVRLALESKGFDAIPALDEAIEKEKDPNRQNSLEGTVTQIFAADKATEQLQSDDDKVRGEGRDFVRNKTYDDSIFKKLLTLLEDPREGVRQSVKTLILDDNDVRFSRTLLVFDKLKNAKYPEGKIAAMHMLNHVKDTGASVPYLIGFLKDPDQKVRDRAIRQLRRSPLKPESKTSVAPALLEFLQNERETKEMKLAAVETLQGLDVAARIAIPEIRRLIATEKERKGQLVLAECLLSIGHEPEDLKKAIETFGDILVSRKAQSVLMDRGKELAPVLKKMVAKEPGNKSLEVALEFAEFEVEDDTEE